MTTEEKLQHFYEVSMDTAREEATKVLDEYKAALETEMERHKQEKQAASESQFKMTQTTQPEKSTKRFPQSISILKESFPKNSRN